MDYEGIAKRISELHYPNKPNSIIDEPYRKVRMKTLERQVMSELIKMDLTTPEGDKQ